MRCLISCIAARDPEHKGVVGPLKQYYWGNTSSSHWRFILGRHQSNAYCLGYQNHSSAFFSNIEGLRFCFLFWLSTGPRQSNRANCLILVAKLGNEVEREMSVKKISRRFCWTCHNPLCRISWTREWALSSCRIVNMLQKLDERGFLELGPLTSF